MQIFEIEPTEYKGYFPDPYHVFNSVEFNVLNQEKCDQLHFLIFKDSKVKLGLIAGIGGSNMISPFSAPFGSFSYTRRKLPILDLEESIQALDGFAINRGIESIQLTLPPFFYNNSFISKMVNVLSRYEYTVKYIDLNHTFNLALSEKGLLEKISRSARKNLNTSLKAELSFSKVTSHEDIKSAYEIVKLNRTAKGYPLKMSFEDVLETIRIIDADFFLVKRFGLLVASAMVYHIAPGIVQVIYWGDDPQYREYRVMDFLSFSLFKYYKEYGSNYLDIGPSTEQGVPNYGLCDFKDGIGCDSYLKYTFGKKII